MSYRLAVEHSLCLAVQRSLVLIECQLAHAGVMAREDVGFSAVGGDDFSFVLHHFTGGSSVGGATDGFDEGPDLAVVCGGDRFFDDILPFLLFGLFNLGTRDLTLFQPFAPVCFDLMA